MSTEPFTKKLLYFGLLQVAVLFAIVWFIAGNDRLFRSTVSIEQRLVSRDDSIRKKAQQDLLGLNADAKKEAVDRLIPELEQDDLFKRKWAAISLALVGPPAQAAIPALLQNVSAKEKDVAQAARVALSEIGAPDAQQLPSLLKTLQDPRESVRCEAVLSIGKMGSAAQDAVPLLLEMVRRPSDTPACYEETLGSLAGGLPYIVPSMLELLGDASGAVRRKASHVLALSGVKTPETITPIFDALSQKQDFKVRTWLTKALQLPYVPDPDRTDVLMAALEDGNVAVRLQAARWIRENAAKGPKTPALIAKMLKDPEAFIRRLGLEALRLSGLRTTDIMQKVAKAQRDPDPGVRCRAAEALIEAGSTDRVSLALLIGDLRRDEDTARCAEDVLGLAGLFDSDVIQSMTRLVQEEKNPDLRSRATQVLMHLGPRARQAVPALLRAQKEGIPGAEMALKAIRASTGRRRR